VFLNTPKPRVGLWPLIGIYVGERVMSADRQLREVFPAAAKIRGYAVRSEAVYDWKPEMLYGRTLVQELMATPPTPLGS
jgi:hypothetical protein